jgi:hypothetical protein
MPGACTVVIGSAALLDDLRRQIRDGGDILAFADSETLTALEVIVDRRPRAVTLERLFAATSRGAALINRVKADPSLTETEIRIVSHDGTYARVSPRRSAAPPQPAPVAEPQTAAVEVAVAPPVIDFRGTRRAPRMQMAEGTEAQVDGAPATLVDLSTIGAQIISPAPLKPQQRVRMVLSDALAVVKLSASVAWASFEIPKGVSQYRAGVEFVDGQPDAIEAFCSRHLADTKSITEG